MTSDLSAQNGPKVTYSPSPRPSFDVPTLITRAGVTRHIWGDDEAGEVADWIYASTGLIHCLVFGVGPGGSFRHSPEFRTVFGADEALLVLEGTMLLANPETGEVVRVPAGEMAFFRADTWHHAFAAGDGPPSSRQAGDADSQRPKAAQAAFAERIGTSRLPPPPKVLAR